jgi:hypothetical protein
MSVTARQTETPRDLQVSGTTPTLRLEPRNTPYVVTRAEIAECNCPEPCERDHANE